MRARARFRLAAMRARRTLGLSRPCAHSDTRMHSGTQAPSRTTALVRDTAGSPAQRLDDASLRTMRMVPSVSAANATDPRRNNGCDRSTGRGSALLPNPPRAQRNANDGSAGGSGAGCGVPLARIPHGRWGGRVLQPDDGRDCLDQAGECVRFIAQLNQRNGSGNAPWRCGKQNRPCQQTNKPTIQHGPQRLPPNRVAHEAGA